MCNFRRAGFKVDHHNGMLSLLWSSIAPPVTTGRLQENHDSWKMMARTLPPSPAKPRRQNWWNDHRFLRLIWTNFHKIDVDVWRQNHPSAARLAQLKTMGAASVLSLRGDGSEVSQIEAAACAQLGLVFRGISLRASKLPTPIAIVALIDALRDLPKPIVVHCKSGADRTGLAGAIYLHVFKGVPLEQAREQLSVRFFHNPWGKARIVYRFLDAYVAAHAATGIGFEEWVRTEYEI